jgi:hypothetical protein
MKVRELIALLGHQPPDATVYVSTTEADFDHPVLLDIERVDAWRSTAYGTAVVVELGD